MAAFVLGRLYDRLASFQNGNGHHHTLRCVRVVKASEYCGGAQHYLSPFRKETKSAKSFQAVSLVLFLSVQFLAIELARNVEGHNAAVRGKTFTYEYPDEEPLPS